MKIFQTQSERIKGTDWKEVHRKVMIFYKKIEQKSKRRPYIRCAYFKKEKVFLELFWHHLFQKVNWRDRVRRLRYFPAGIELIEKGKIAPMIKESTNKKGENFYRFKGATRKKEVFFVQIKEDKKTGQKWLMSIFPEKK